MSKEDKAKQRRDAYKDFSNYITPNRGFSIPWQLRLNVKEAGVFFGCADKSDQIHYVGMPQGADGNIIIIGGNGSGKSSGIIKPTLSTWNGAICATDIKGELSTQYERFAEQALQSGSAVRPAIIFDPAQVGSIGYDPFWWISQDDSANLYSNITDMAQTIIPKLPNDIQPFWVESEQSAFAAALCYYSKLGLSFDECLCNLLSISLSTFCEKVKNSNNSLANMLLGQISEMKPETLANIDRGLRNKLLPLAADSYISRAFRGKRDGARCFSWEDLAQSNIFLRIPPDKINQWGYAVNLMYAQLIRFLERRPEQYSADGKNNLQTLLLLDEFPRLGKLDVIVDAIPTLRSKNVNFCLAIQSIAQLDRLYGEYGRRIICDNCQYQAILRANDAETQDYLCRLIGTAKVLQENVSMNLDERGEKMGYSVQRTIVREPCVFPYELSATNDILLLSPYGRSRVKKQQIFNEKAEDSPACDSSAKHDASQSDEKGAGILTMEERCKIARERAEQSEKAQRVADKLEKDRKEKEDNRRKYIVGDLVIAAFPSLLDIVPGTPTENEIRFQKLKRFLATLANSPELIKAVEEKQKFKDYEQNTDESSPQNPRCVDGREEG